MKLREFLLSIGVATVMAIAPVAAAADTLEGTVISAGEGTVVMQDQDGKTMHEIGVAPEALITRDGEEARLENLVIGDLATITTEKRDTLPTVVVAIHAKSSP
jgi:acyl CoA:acetate/3-ketoacid CoA transferase alpha subunit